MIASYGRAIGFGRVEVGKDETGLARWTWMSFSTDGLVRRFVLAYRPRMPSSLKNRGINWYGKTVCEQHYWYYCQKGYPNSDPIWNFDKDFLEQLSNG